VHQPVVRSARPLVARGRYGGYLARRALPVLRRFSAECPTAPGTQVPYATSSVNFPSPANASTLTSPHHIERPRATGFNPPPVSISRNNLQLFSRDPPDLYPSPFFFHDTARLDFGSKLIPPPPCFAKKRLEVDENKGILFAASCSKLQRDRFFRCAAPTRLGLTDLGGIGSGCQESARR
jgi:hypothetical protein